jgi:hypothetical protein
MSDYRDLFDRAALDPDPAFAADLEGPPHHARPAGRGPGRPAC